jgi:dCTP deaminase
MSIWSSERLNQRAGTEKLITPFQTIRVRHGAYELSLGSEAFITSRPGADKIRLTGSDHILIPPGQFALLHTAEVVRIPADALGLLSIKAGAKLRGLVNISGFHVDPGFEGQLVFSVHNAGAHPVRLSHGDPVFLMWFCALTEPTSDLYAGTHRHQCGISPQAITDIDGEIVAPQALQQRVKDLELELGERMKDLERKQTMQDRIIWGLFGVLAASVLALAISRLSESKATVPPASVTAAKP